jgi:FMN reductase
MRIVVLAGSPSLKSRSSALLQRVEQWLRRHGHSITRFQVRDFPAEDLLYARFDSPQVRQLIEAVEHAEGVVVATPVYKAAYSGALKVMLDLLPERALSHKVVLPIATGGSGVHMLAMDYALKPVLAALKAQEMLHGVYAEDNQITYTEDDGADLAPVLEQRLDDALEHFHSALARRPKPLEAHLLNDRLIRAQASI